MTFSLHRRSFWLKAGLALSLVLMLGRGARAASTDSTTLSVTPGNISYGVVISSVTAGSGYAFGTVNLGATTLSTAAIVVTNSGNIAEYFALSVSNSSPDSWTPGTVTSTNTFVLGAKFSASQPTVATTTTTLTNTAPNIAAGKYSQGARTNAASTQKLWLELIMPTQLNGGTGAQQSMTLSINGQAN